MERIASFTVNHDVLTPGLYLSRRDGSVTTFDLRFKKPNTGDLLTNAQMHSVEHIIATALRNSPQKDAVIYFGPMGCQTGFYFLFDSQRLTDAQAIDLLRQVFAQGAVWNACPASPPASAATTTIWTWRWPGNAAPSTPASSTAGRWKSWSIRNKGRPDYWFFQLIIYHCTLS